MEFGRSVAMQFYADGFQIFIMCFCGNDALFAFLCLGNDQSQTVERFAGVACVCVIVTAVCLVYRTAFAGEMFVICQPIAMYFTFRTVAGHSAGQQFRADNA